MKQCLRGTITLTFTLAHSFFLLAQFFTLLLILTAHKQYCTPCCKVHLLLSVLTAAEMTK